MGEELLSIGQVAALTACADVDQLATEHLGQIAERLWLLSAMQGALQDMLDQCSHTTIHECRIIEALSPEADTEPV